MGLCKWCREKDEVPDDAQPLTQGDTCWGCGMPYNHERAKLHDGPTLDEFGDGDE